MTPLNRRDMMRLLGLGLFAGSFPGAAVAALQRKKLGIALLGLGYYSENLLAPALQATQFCELRGIITGSPEKIPRWQAKYGISDRNTYTYDSMEELANNPEIDVVYVVTPTSLHLPFAVRAANTGKHVWCEKPMAMTEQECQTMIDSCQRNNVMLSIGYRMQHEPNTRRFAGFSKSREFGDITSLQSFAGYAGRGLPADNWRMKKNMGGGALYDMGVYPINGARFVGGLEPVAVTAHHEKSHPQIFTEVDETTYFTLEYADGRRAECATSVVKSFNYLNVECQRGWYKLAPMQSYSGVTGTTSDGRTFNPIQGMQQSIQMDNDALAILGQGPHLVNGEEGRKDIRIVEAIFRAAQNQQRVQL